MIASRRPCTRPEIEHLRKFIAYAKQSLNAASPVQLGRLPWSYPRVWRVFSKAARDAGIGSLGTHTMRHS